MKIVFYGDSVTDAMREKDKTKVCASNCFGGGYVIHAAGRLYLRDPVGFEILNRGVAGNTITDLYARAKPDVWNEKPDVLSILVGINDVGQELRAVRTGVEPPRFEKCYRALIEETLERLPQTRIMLMEPFMLRGSITEEHYEGFQEVYVYAATVRRLAAEYGLWFVPLQKELTAAAEKYGDVFLRDGVHPTRQGAAFIADIWLREFDKMLAERPMDRAN